jgi:Protein of unknown function (DUF3000)
VTVQDPTEAPEEFRRAVAALRSARLRPEVLLEEAPAPQRLAPWAVAMTADVVASTGGTAGASAGGPPDDTEDDLATGRFVVLHDPQGHETWEGVFRIVTFARAAVESDVASDPMLPSVGWSWLIEALEGRQAPYTAPSGTVTRVSSESFGSLIDRPGSAEIEIRASWSALDPDLAPHLEAWGELLASIAGLPPLSPGVVAMPRTRRTH